MLINEQRILNCHLKSAFRPLLSQLALIAMESPELKKAVFVAVKKRPKEALFIA
jgi:hypothetical protein